MLPFKVVVFFALYFAASQLHAQQAPFHAAETLGMLNAGQLQEVSGIIASTKKPGFYFVHNDSGDAARIYLINGKAEQVATYQLENCEVRDCEDIARYNYRGTNYLVLGDIGDNRGKRKDIHLYLFPEPIFEEGTSSYIIPDSVIRKVHLRYPDKPRDAEAFFVDPLDGSLYLISKRDFKSQIYQASLFSSAPVDSLLLKEVGKLDNNFMTAADISSDGRFIAIKNLVNVYFWERGENETVAQCLRRVPRRLDYTIEPQGEAICFDLSGTALLTVSERTLGLLAPLYYYKKY